MTNDDIANLNALFEQKAITQRLTTESISKQLPPPPYQDRKELYD